MTQSETTRKLGGLFVNYLSFWCPDALEQERGIPMVIGELKIKKTRFAELGYANVAGQMWRIVDIDTGSVVGPQYRTQIELLADLDRYAREYGCNG